MRAQSFLFPVKIETVTHKRAKHPVKIKVLTHINKSRPGRKIRDNIASLKQ